eukprot:gnl/MRDRNA2_/MRDRNA2_171120_c0_seq1.p1 gnl/MRDRNA2_/MRDRNA2_171120_c0~~gnl/MRDRNA2_/MRDRNA2_171120_c0_seq1.p1  ORF type:complete len:279 (+),score=62.54 gnl/MRDRNA2_/MRDRNA2_171120_c0_seq1:97-933(+)
MHGWRTNDSKPEKIQPWVHGSATPRPEQIEKWDEERLQLQLSRLGLQSKVSQDRQAMVAEVLHCLKRAERYSFATLNAKWGRFAGQPIGPPLIFLDVDGVLNHPKAINAPRRLDPAKLQLLASLVKRTGAAIVLSTTWRVNALSKLALIDSLCEVGLFEDCIVGETPDITQHERTREISAWLDDHPPASSSRWVALDDLELGYENPKLMSGHFVCVDSAIGLSERDVEQAAALLEPPKIAAPQQDAMQLVCNTSNITVGDEDALGSWRTKLRSGCRLQ